jgi:hypothetical protein
VERAGPTGENLKADRIKADRSDGRNQTDHSGEPRPLTKLALADLHSEGALVAISGAFLPLHQLNDLMRSVIGKNCDPQEIVLAGPGKTCILPPGTMPL